MQRAVARARPWRASCPARLYRRSSCRASRGVRGAFRSRPTARASRFSTCASRASWPPTRSSAPASRLRSRTSCRTPLARLLALLETAALPAANVDELLEQGKAEVENIRELIDDVLFLSELETGRAVVSLASSPAAPVVREVMDGLAERASRAGVLLDVELDDQAQVPLRPRMLRVVVENLAENTIRYAGDGVTFSISVTRAGDDVVIVAADDGVGVSAVDLPRLFERFYRADRARASRGTGLGLAIVKHIVTSAGGYVEATSREGLEIRITFPR